MRFIYVLSLILVLPIAVYAEEEYDYLEDCKFVANYANKNKLKQLEFGGLEQLRKSNVEIYKIVGDEISFTMPMYTKVDLNGNGQQELIIMDTEGRAWIDFVFIYQPEKPSLGYKQLNQDGENVFLIRLNDKFYFISFNNQRFLDVLWQYGKDNTFQPICSYHIAEEVSRTKMRDSDPDICQLLIENKVTYLNIKDDRSQNNADAVDIDNDGKPDNVMGRWSYVNRPGSYNLFEADENQSWNDNSELNRLLSEARGDGCCAIMKAFRYGGLTYLKIGFPPHGSRIYLIKDKRVEEICEIDVESTNHVDIIFR